jgi:thiamine-phosphate pyrophosphorylase
MKLIAITPSQFVAGEAARIIALLDHEGFSIVHLRKPGAGRSACAALLDQLPERLVRRVVTHDHFSLCAEYPLLGIHLNGRNPVAPQGYEGHLSCSCHSLEEVARRKSEMDYVFLSPIYDSISKQGYPSHFSQETLDAAADEGLIDHRVVALGGITFQHLPQLRRWHFGGAAMLGAIWDI